MIYLDTSVALAALLSEDVLPPPTLWAAPLFSSRLLEYELWTRLHSKGLSNAHSESARDILSRVNIIEMSPDVLERVLEPFPIRVRTLDAIHLSTFNFLHRHRVKLKLATYDQRMKEAALSLGWSILDLPLSA